MKSQLWTLINLQIALFRPVAKSVKQSLWDN